MTYRSNVPQCLTCRNYRSPLESADTLEARMRDGTSEMPICAAYTAPPGIPDVIWFNQYDHRQPRDDDHGVHWEPIEPDTEYPEDLIEQAQTAAVPPVYTDPGPETVGEERTYRLP